MDKAGGWCRIHSQDASEGQVYCMDKARGWCRIHSQDASEGKVSIKAKSSN